MSTLTILGLLVVFAFLFPELGKKEGLLGSQYLTQGGVFLIFLGIGFSLKREKWMNGFRSRLIILQLLVFQFLISPLIGWGAVLLFPSIDYRIQFALFFLTALPTTISTASVFTQKSGENPALSAIVSILSNLIALFLTPLWISIYLSERSFGMIPYRTVLTPIFLNLVLPTVLGFIGRAFVGSFFEKQATIISKMNMGIVFFILYTAFCDVFAMKIGSDIDLSLNEFLILALMTFGLLLFNHGLLFCFAKKFHPAQTYSFLFIGAQKSIVTGAPIALAIVSQAESIFNGTFTYGLVLLPFAIYHPAQILLGTWIIKLKRS